MHKKELGEVKELMLAGLNNAVTQRIYHRIADEFISWMEPSKYDKFDRVSVLNYVKFINEKKLSVSSVNQHITVVFKLATDAVDNGYLDEATLHSIKRIKKPKLNGSSCGTWLTKEQAQQMLDAPSSSTVKGVRDRAILGVLIGCGLRRSELVTLDVEHIQMRNKRWVIADLYGKHMSVRTIPMAAWVKKSIDKWLEVSGIKSGVLFPRVRKGGIISSDRMSTQSVWGIIDMYSPISNVSPHDLRRTFAKLAHQAGTPLEQIQKSMGHSTLAITERYLNVELDLEHSPSDSIVMVT